MSVSTLERLAGADRAWLLMERPTNLMVVVGLIVLEERLDRSRCRDLIATRFLVHQRFRCVPVADALGARWVEAEQFDIDDHIAWVALPEPGTQCELQALLGELAGTPFNPGRPLWTFHVVERYRGGSAIIVRIHHCYADGVALVRVLLSLTDEGGAVAQRASAALSADGHPHTLVELMPLPVAAALRGATDLIGAGLGYLLHPTQAAAAAGEALAYSGELLHIAALADDPPTCLKRPLSGARRAAWAEPFSLTEVHTIAHVLGCTINDVLLSTLAGALGGYLAAQGDEVTNLKIRAVVPVNLRAEDEPPTLGNRFGLVFVELPIGLPHPLERLCAVHTAMHNLKGSAQAAATFGMLSIIGTLPSQMAEPTTALYSAKASLVVSNLPGPREALHLAGAEIRQVLFWVPEAGSIGTGVSILTYRDDVQFGVISDREMIREPDQLVARIGAEFERLVYLVLLGGASFLENAAASECAAEPDRGA
ncbi:MAG TPA: wax ester/triacylglycerol synthase family O-acyltransferase [Steroidobacteraceae bacterium]|nr:wax ester/triacylglycerol synthase family O-acyltransferase [Steroidobacteraceae bacterium]